MEHGISALAQGLIFQGSTAAWVCVAVAFLALCLVLFFAISSRTRPASFDQAAQAFRALDIEAFRNLVDPSEEAFLRDNLSPASFRKIKRQRAWAAFVYTREAGRAAAGLAQIGQVAQRSTNAEIAASGAQLAENAFRLRIQTAVAGAVLLAEVILPVLPGRSLPSLVDRLERSSETLFRMRQFSPGERSLAHSKSA